MLRKVFTCCEDQDSRRDEEEEGIDFSRSFCHQHVRLTPFCSLGRDRYFFVNLCPPCFVNSFFFHVRLVCVKRSMSLGTSGVLCLTHCLYLKVRLSLKNITAHIRIRLLTHTSIDLPNLTTVESEE